MKNIFKFGLGALAAIVGLASCSSYEPRGYEEVPNLPKATDITATVGAKRVVTVNWKLPAAPAGMEISDVQFILNANTENPVSLGPTGTSYDVEGVMWNEESVFTVKVCYDERYISEGSSLVYEMPYEELPGVTDLNYTVKGRKVLLTWKNPAGITGVRVLRNGELQQTLDATATSAKLAAQPMEEECVYSVEPLYDTYYPGVAVSTKVITIPLIEGKVGYLMTAPSIDLLPDDDEVAAATWFAAQPGCELVQASDLDKIDSDAYPVLWVMIDRLGLPLGWENLPPEVSSPTAIAALKAYSEDGGNLYLSNMATQLTVPLGMVDASMAPTVFGSGNGGSGTDVWTINPILGVDFQNGSDQGYYDHSDDDIFQGLLFDDPNGYGYMSIPMIGPGQREDHNCLWDCNIYGKGSERDVIANFEKVTDSTVFATWGHVRDHCVAGLVLFNANANHGRCIANGFAAYEWAQNSGENPYQSNIEKLTQNIFNILLK